MIKFHPQQGTVLMCDFSASLGSEMNKRRHAIVVSPRLRRRSGTYLVVLVSTAAPHIPQPFHYRFSAGSYPFFKADVDVWAKGNMLTHVADARLDRLILEGRYQAPRLAVEDLEGVLRAVAAALGIFREDQPTELVEETYAEVSTMVLKSNLRP